MTGMVGGCGEVGKRRPQLRQYRIDGRMMRRHIHLDAPRQPALGVHHRDYGIDLLRRPGDHDLARRGIHRQGQVGVAGDQRLGPFRVQLEQRHRALSGQRDISRDRVAITRNPSAGLSAPATTAAVTSPSNARSPHRAAHRGAPQLGQRQLHTHQHRLDAVDATSGSPAASTCCSENPTCSTNTGSNSATAAANTGSSASSCRPMPAHCEPCPE